MAKKLHEAENLMQVIIKENKRLRKHVGSLKKERFCKAAIYRQLSRQFGEDIAQSAIHFARSCVVIAATRFNEPRQKASSD